MELKDVKSKSGNIIKAGFENGVIEVHFQPRTKDASPAIYRSTKPVTQKEWDEFSSTFDKEENSTGSYFHKNLRQFKEFKVHENKDNL